MMSYIHYSSITVIAWLVFIASQAMANNEEYYGHEGLQPHDHEIGRHQNHNHEIGEQPEDGQNEGHAVMSDDEDMISNGSLVNSTSGWNETEASNITYYNNMLNDIWLNITSVMDLFTQREYDNSSAVQALTAAYRYTLRQQKKLKTLPLYLKKPFIVIEGLDHQKKDALARKLALYLNGHVVLNPPDTFDVVLRHFPPNSTVLNNGFYTLCTYIAALHVRAAVQKAPAVIPGYWLGRAAYTIAKHFVDEPPPFDSKFWIWPKDLVKPDVVFFLDDKYSFHQFEDHKLVRRYLHVFHNWIDPNCIPIGRTQSVESMMEEIEPYLEDL